MLHLGKDLLDEMIRHSLDAYPLEACGLLIGTPGENGTARAESAFPAENVAGSARVYELDPRAYLRADRQAESTGCQIIGVYHSHTHTDPMPSRTDIQQAPDPDWHYVLVSLRDVHPSVRSWRTSGGTMAEEQIVVY
jgi:[CysO sulfur-carrier protein]-S-L-cysteine hydrolase